LLWVVGAVIALIIGFIVDAGMWTGLILGEGQENIVYSIKKVVPGLVSFYNSPFCQQQLK
jgi:hypothetical protein